MSDAGTGSDAFLAEADLTAEDMAGFEDMFRFDMSAMKNIDLLIEMFKYPTFEYKVTFKSLVKARRLNINKVKQAKSEFRLVVKKGTSTDTVIVKIDDEMLSHMKILLTFAERRNSLLEARGELRECLNSLFSLYGITRGGSRSKPKVLTMWHIAAAFPQLVVRIYHEGSGDAIVSLAQLGLPEKASRGFVSGKVHSVVNKETLQEIKFICLYCLVLIDNAINSSKPRLFKSIASYFRAGSCSKSCSEELKTLMPTAAHLGLLRTVNGVEVYQPYLARANIFCMAKLRALYPGEDLHNVLL